MCFAADCYAPMWCDAVVPRFPRERAPQRTVRCAEVVPTSQEYQDMKITKIDFRPVVREHDKGVFIGYANVEITFAPDVSLTLYSVELNVWDDNGFAVRTKRHQAERNGRWYTDAFLSDTFRKHLANALLKDRVIASAAELATEQRDSACSADEKSEGILL